MLFGNTKNAFWEALLLTVIVFVLGLLLGVAYEGARVDEINNYYAQSEISLMDVIGLNNLISSVDVSCEILINSNIDFADRIYEEGTMMERFEEAETLSDNMKLAHKRYDLLRSFLWMNVRKAQSQCDDEFSSVVYLYKLEQEDLEKKAMQNVWSKILFDLKQKKQNKIILIPIAVDRNLTTVESLISEFEIKSYPAVIINDRHVVSQLSSVEELEKLI